MSDIVQRLRRKTVAGQPVFPTPLDIEAANEIERLRAQLADLQGERDVAELSRDAAHARLAECESQLRAVALKP